MRIRSTESYYENTSTNSRENFITKTYLHLLGAIGLFVFLEYLLMTSELGLKLAGAMMGSWLIVIGGMLVISWLATSLAQSRRSKGLQYLGLIAFTVMESIIFLPILLYANHVSGGTMIQSAATITLVGFCGLSAIVFFTRKDFSFLRSILLWCGLIALIAIVSSLIFGFQLGVGFSAIMVAFAGAAILYDTSNILHHYREEDHVAASLSLFASVMMLFYYVLMLFIQSRD